MTTDLKVNLNTLNCELSDLNRFKVMSRLQSESLPSGSNVSLTITQNYEELWVFDLSLKYARGHIATLQTDTTLDKVIESGLADLRRNLDVHKIQSLVETFHFDKANEYDFFTEISQEAQFKDKPNLNTMILEDDPAASIVLQTTLKSLGCLVDSYELPATALDAIVKKRYDLLVLDWNLPYMKGHEFLIAADCLLKKRDVQGQPNRMIPVVICTSIALEDITLPPVSHFFFCNHWHKSLPFSSVLNSFDVTTKQINGRKKVAA